MSHSLRNMAKLAGLATAAALVATPAAAKEFHALLIGASQYEIPEIQDLDGPKEDVRVMWDLLVNKRKFKPENVRVLADSLPEDLQREAGVDCKADPSDANKTVGANCPNLQTILDTLDDMADNRVKSGDFVYIHFSGHGVRVPTPEDDKAREPDFHDEAFVPIDVRPRKRQTPHAEGLLIDDQIGERLARMRKAGAFIWLVADSCHSGGLSRGPKDGAKARKIDPRVLGISEDVIEAARAKEREKERAAPAREAKSRGLEKPAAFDFEAISGGDDEGGFVAFYAAQSTQPTLEMPFDNGNDADGNPQSVYMGGLTRALGTALSIYPEGSYSQIAQKVIDEYHEFGATMPIPVFDGDLDKTVFAGAPVERSWKVTTDDDKLTVAAGRLNNIEEGSILNLYPEGKAGKAEALLGCAEVRSAGLSRSDATTVECQDKPALEIDALPEATQAMLDKASVRFFLSVAAPFAGDKARAEEVAMAGAAVEAAQRLAQTDTARKMNLDWVAPKKNADLSLEVSDGRIWMYSRHGEKQQSGPRPSPSVAIVEGDPEATARKLIENIWRVARAQNLMRMASSFSNPEAGQTWNVLDNVKLQAYFYADPSDPAKKKERGEKRKCPKVPRRSIPETAVKFNFEDFPEVAHCDVIYVEIANEGDNPVDVTLLFVDSESGIQSFRPGGSARILSRKDGSEKANRIVPIQIVTWDHRRKRPLTVGREQLVMIAVERDKNDPNFGLKTTFTHLAQESMTKTRGRSKQRGAGGTFATLLNDAGMASAKTRGALLAAGSEPESVKMQTIGWKVNAPEKAAN